MAAARPEPRSVRRQFALHGIPPEIMELIADIYIACAGRDPDRPAYTEDYMQRKLKRSPSLGVGWSHGDVSAACVLLDSEVAAIAQRAGMTSQQKEAWRLHISGMRPAEIAAHLRVSHPTAVRLVRQAERRVREFCARYGGLHSVYRSETRRSVYRKPGHCAAMYCRRLGYCRFALSMGEMEE